MSICPICRKKVKKSSADKKKINGVWIHRHKTWSKKKEKK